MTAKNSISIPDIKQKLAIPKPWDTVIIFVLNILIAIPLFLVAHQNLVELSWSYHLDRVLLFIGILIVIQLLLRLFKTAIIWCLVLYVFTLIYGTLFGGYGFARVFEDYRYMIYAMSENPKPQDLIISKLLPFPNKSKIINAVEFANPKVRNFAVAAATKHFKNVKGYHKNRQMIQCFAVFKEINRQWNYVNDPKGREYIARATESLQHFSGDCDDHAILMSAAIKAIGGTPRIIHTGGHLYPEMLIGNTSDLETAIFLIKKVLFVEETKNHQIHYHIDERGQIWLNLDYTATYPGGKFMKEEILGALTFF